MLIICFMNEKRKSWQLSETWCGVYNVEKHVLSIPSSMYGYWNIPDSKVHGANMANMLAPWTLLSGIICLTGKWRVDNCQKHDAPYITLKSMYCRFHRLCMDIEISQIARFMGPTWPTCWPHEPCYQGSYVWRGSEELTIVRNMMRRI